MKKKFDYDLIVLGSGAAGSSAAFAAARAGEKVALVEAGKWGGSALNSSDVPRRALLNFSHLYSEAKSGSRFGLSSKSLGFNFPTAANWRALAVRRSGAGSKTAFEKEKISCFSGRAAFLSPYEVAVGDKILAARQFVLATGSRPDFGEISGVESATCLTPADALRLSRPPKSVFVVGAGSTGCELADFFAELGSAVFLGESAASVLPREDEEVGRLLGSFFSSRLGVKILPQSRVVAVEPSLEKKGSWKVIFKRGGRERSVVVDSVVLATGSRPAVSDLGLENAGVKFSRSGVEVDSMLRSSMKHIFAAGDCLGGESSSERAAYEGALAASNLSSRQKNLRNYDGFIRLTETFPAVASTGLTENDCVTKGIKYKKSLLPLSSISASNTSDFRFGFVKLLADGKDKILGGTVVSPDAELVIQEVAVAVRHHFTSVQLASTPHISSSFSELIHLSARSLASAEVKK